MKAIRWFVISLLVLGAVFVVYTWIVLTWAYSNGERAGYVQKLSKKGWLCKTWEGELAMVTVPGSLSEKFYFSVRDDGIAEQINRSIGKRVSLHYEEHVGIPTTCFAETPHFVIGVRTVEDPYVAPRATTPAPQAPATAPQDAPAQPRQ